MSGNAFAKKSVARALTCSVKKLRRHQDIARRVFFLQTADRRYANDPADVEGTQRVNVRPMIQLMRENAMAAPVPGQKINLPSMHLAADNSDGWLIHGRP